MCLLLPPIPQKRNQGVDYDELVSTWGKDGADHLLYINDLRSQCQTRADAIAHMPHAKRWADSAEAMKWADLVGDISLPLEGTREPLFRAQHGVVTPACVLHECPDAGFGLEGLRAEGLGFEGLGIRLSWVTPGTRHV